jgi:aquaporin related protein
MAIPLAYQSNSKNDFTSSRTPPTPRQYGPPILQKYDMVVDRPKARWDVSDSIRNHIIAMLGEFVGTLSLFFGFAAVQISKSHPDNLAGGVNVSSPSLLQIFFISAGFGLSFTINAWIFFRVSGSAFNPAVSIVQSFSVHEIKPDFCPGDLRAMSGRCGTLVPRASGCSSTNRGRNCSCWFGLGSFPGPFDAKNTLGSGTTKVQGVFIEMVLTTELIFTIMMLAVEKHRASFVAPLGIGIALFLGHLIGKHRHGRYLLFQN